jgi:hypothetical protein
LVFSLLLIKISHFLEENDLEIDDLPHYYAINIDKISADTIVQYYDHEDFEIACSGLSITGGSWSHSFNAEDLKTYIINKNEEKKTIEMQKNLIRVQKNFDFLFIPSRKLIILNLIKDIQPYKQER